MMLWSVGADWPGLHSARRYAKNRIGTLCLVPTGSRTEGVRLQLHCVGCGVRSARERKAFMNPTLQKAVLAAAFEDGSVTGTEWSGLGTAFFIAFWGTFKSNTTVVRPNRTVWTPEDRLVEVAKIDAGGQGE